MNEASHQQSHIIQFYLYERARIDKSLRKKVDRSWGMGKVWGEIANVEGVPICC
jgi:hypothetical protein